MLYKINKMENTYRKGKKSYAKRYKKLINEIKKQ